MKLSWKFKGISQLDHSPTNLQRTVCVYTDDKLMNRKYLGATEIKHH